MKKISNNEYGCLRYSVCFTFIFAIISGSCIMIGCNLDVPGGCPLYHKIHARVRDTHLMTTNCTICIKWSESSTSISHCLQSHHTLCYTLIIYFDDIIDKYECETTFVFGSDQISALNTLSQYSIGSYHTMLQTGNDITCRPVSLALQQVQIIGIVFLILTAFIPCTWILYCISPMCIEWAIIRRNARIRHTGYMHIEDIRAKESL